MLRKDRSPVKKRPNIPKKVKTPEKLPTEKSMEELEESSRAQVKAFFAQKKKERQDPVKELLKNIPRETLERTVDNLYIPPVRPLSDYERGIDKQHSSQMEETKKCGKKVPQLGEQEVQSIAPLIVPFYKAALYNDNIVAQEIHDETGYAIAELA